MRRGAGELRATVSFNPSAIHRSSAAMPTLSFSVSDENARQLKERAQERGLSIEELLDRITDEVVRQPGADFDEMAQHILAKNRELYRRLAT